MYFVRTFPWFQRKLFFIPLYTWLCLSFDYKKTVLKIKTLKFQSKNIKSKKIFKANILWSRFENNHPYGATKHASFFFHAYSAKIISFLVNTIESNDCLATYFIRKSVICFSLFLQMPKKLQWTIALRCADVRN